MYQSPEGYRKMLALVWLGQFPHLFRFKWVTWAAVRKKSPHLQVEESSGHVTPICAVPAKVMSDIVLL